MAILNHVWMWEAEILFILELKKMCCYDVMANQPINRFLSLVHPFFLIADESNPTNDAFFN